MCSRIWISDVDPDPVVGKKSSKLLHKSAINLKNFLNLFLIKIFYKSNSVKTKKQILSFHVSFVKIFWFFLRQSFLLPGSGSWCEFRIRISIKTNGVLRKLFTSGNNMDQIRSARTHHIRRSSRDNPIYDIPAWRLATDGVMRLVVVAGVRRRRWLSTWWRMKRRRRLPAPAQRLRERRPQHQQSVRPT